MATMLLRVPGRRGLENVRASKRRPHRNPFWTRCPRRFSWRLGYDASKRSFWRHSSDWTISGLVGADRTTSNMLWRVTGTPAVASKSTLLRTSDFIARSQKGSEVAPPAEPAPIEAISVNRLTRFSVRLAPAPWRRDSCSRKLKLHLGSVPKRTRSESPTHLGCVFHPQGGFISGLGAEDQRTRRSRHGGNSRASVWPLPDVLSPIRLAPKMTSPSQASFIRQVSFPAAKARSPPKGWIFGASPTSFGPWTGPEVFVAFAGSLTASSPPRDSG